MLLLSASRWKILCMWYPYSVENEKIVLYRLNKALTRDMHGTVAAISDARGKLIENVLHKSVALSFPAESHLEWIECSIGLPVVVVITLIGRKNLEPVLV